jgi:hypothetical protein
MAPLDRRNLYRNRGGIRYGSFADSSFVASDEEND